MHRLLSIALGLTAAAVLAGCATMSSDDDVLCPGGADCPEFQAR